MIKLGLVGEGIAKSQSPDLHERLGASLGLPVRYDLIDSLGVADFDFPAAKTCSELALPIRCCSMQRDCAPKTPITPVLSAPTATLLAINPQARCY